MGSEKMKEKDIVIIGGLGLLGLWLWNKSQNTTQNLEGGGVSSGGLGATEDIAATPVYNDTPYSGGANGYTSDNAIINKQGKIVKNLQARKKPGKGKPSKNNNLITNAISNPASETPGAARAALDVMSLGLYDVISMSGEAKESHISPPWWSFIFPPITYPIGLAVATSRKAGTANVSAESGSQWTRIPDTTSKSVDLGIAGATTPKTDITTLYGPILANYPAYNPSNEYNFAKLSILPLTNVYGNPLTTSELMANLVRAGKISTYDAYGGAQAFPQGRDVIESVSNHFWGGVNAPSKKQTATQLNTASATSLKLKTIKKTIKKK